MCAVEYGRARRGKADHMNANDEIRSQGAAKDVQSPNDPHDLQDLM